MKIPVTMLSAPSWLVILFGLNFTLATSVHSWFQNWPGNRVDAKDLLDIMIGDGRRLFANHFFVKADVYFHDGYYPTIFDEVEPSKNLHVAEHTKEDSTQHDPHNGQEKEHDELDDMPDFVKKPANWIDRFGRNFYLTQHRHPEKPSDQRELLPWLLASARLDPSQAKTYTVAAFWLRTQLGKVNEAEQFLREGLRANPRNPEILFELGRVFYQNRKDPIRARNVWEMSLRYWKEQAVTQKEPDVLFYLQIVTHLARLEEETGHLSQAIEYLKMMLPVSPNPKNIQKQIEELQKLQNAGKTGPSIPVQR